MTERKPMHRALAWPVIIAASVFLDAGLYWILGMWSSSPAEVMLAGNLATLAVMAFFLNIGKKVRHEQTDMSEAVMRRRLLAMRRVKYPHVPDNLLLASEETLDRLQAAAHQRKVSNDNAACPGCNGSKSYLEGMLLVPCTVCDGTGRARA